MPPQSEYRTLNEFLRAHKTNVKEQTTHTKIPGGGREAGAYCIPEADLEKFFDLYYKSVISKNETEHLTEKQLANGGPILIDFDFRYEASISDRQYHQEHVDAIVGEYADKLQEIFAFENGDNFPIYIFEKPKVNPQPKYMSDDRTYF